MRLVFVASYLANVAFSLGSLAVLPERVAIHFGGRGLPDNWASKEANALLLVGVHTLLFALLHLTPRLIAIVPPRWVNLPHKHYWLSAENRPVALIRVSTHMWRLGTALFLFMFLAGMLTLLANLSDPVRLDLPLFLVALGLFLAYTVAWCVGFYRAFRLPVAGTPAPPGV